MLRKLGLAQMSDGYENVDQDPEEQYDDEDETPFSCVGFCKLVVHFIATACSPIVGFYIGLRSYLEKLSAWETTHRLVTTEHEIVRRDLTSLVAKDMMPFSTFQDCLKSDSMSLMEDFSLGGNDTCMGVAGPAVAWGLDIPLGHFLSFLNYFGLALTIIFVLILLVQLFGFHHVRGIADGRYIAFTYTVQASMAYRIMAGVIVLYIFLIVLDTFRFLYELYSTGHLTSFMNFVEYLLLTLITLFASAAALVQNARIELPFFDCTTDDFKELMFIRGWSAVTQGNQAFINQLALALLEAKDGKGKSLKAMCESPTKAVEEAIRMAACK